MKISVVTPVRNGARFIRETVASVLSQQGNFELEYIVRDGCSTDGTLDILAEFGEDKRLQVVSQPDGSPQEAINAGMEAATGDIGCWLNADDLFEPGALATVADSLHFHPEYRMVYGRCHVIDASGTRMRGLITAYKCLLGYWFFRSALLCENFISQPATFWRMDLWRQAGGLHTDLVGAWDYELWLRMQTLTRPAPLHTFLSAFRRHPGTISERGFESQLKEEVEVALPYGNALTNTIHRFNAWRTVQIYRWLSS